MTGQEIANKIALQIGARVSNSQVSHAKTFFGKCSEDELVDKFVDYYKKWGKMPRVPNGQRKADVNANSTPLADKTNLERSVRRMRDKLTAITVGANAALELSAPDADGNFANLGRLYRGLSMALCSIREICGPSIAEGGAK